MPRIQAFYNSTQPQILLEQTIQYFVQAQELYDPNKKHTNIALIPDGNRLYTGSLQALSYLYLQQQKHTSYIIVSYSDSIEKPQTTSHKQRKTIRGRTIDIDHQTIHTTLKKRIPTKNTIHKHKPITNHLPFLLLSKPLPIIPIILPTTYTKTHINTIVKIANQQQSGIIIIGNSISHSDKQTSFEQDRKLITKLEQKDKTQRPKHATSYHIAQDISKKTKTNLTLTGYINSSERDNNDQNSTSYIAMIG